MPVQAADCTQAAISRQPAMSSQSRSARSHFVHRQLAQASSPAQARQLAAHSASETSSRQVAPPAALDEPAVPPTLGLAALEPPLALVPPAPPPLVEVWV